MSSKKKENPDVFIDAARRAVRRAGWDPQYDLEILQQGGPATGQVARYGYRADKVRLEYAPQLLDQLTQTLQHVRQSGLGKPIDVLRAIVASRVYLQVGSFKVCPYSAYDYAEILEASADGLRSAGASEPEVNQFTVAVTSLFITSVISGVYAIEGPDPEQFPRGWLMDHIHWSMVNDHTLPSYIGLYVNIQLRLWSKDNNLAEITRDRFPVPFDALDFETDRGVAILLDTFEFADGGKDGLAWVDEHACNFIVEELKYQWKTWPAKAFQYAEMLAPYVVSDEGHRQLPPSRGADQANRDLRPSEQASQRWAAIRPVDTRNVQQLLGQQGFTAQQLPVMPLDPFGARLATDSEFRQQVVSSAIARGKNPLSYYMSLDALDALYRSRTTDVRIESEMTRSTSMAFDIAHMAREEVANGMPGFNHIDWGATRFGLSGQLQLYQKRLPIADQTPARLEMGGLPDLLFVVDSSGSMGWDPVSGTGPYDSLLRAVYSVFHFLEKNRKAQFMRFAAVNFSASTLRTPWHSYDELREVKKLLFRHQGGGTKLDCAALRSIVQESTDRFLCLMVTDSQISNAGDVVNVINLLTGRGHGFVMIQIGNAVPMIKALQSLSHPVHVITNHTQLEGLCLEYARKTWKP